MRETMNRNAVMAHSAMPMSASDPGISPTVAGYALQTSNSLAKCNEMLEEIEQTLFGPDPKVGPCSSGVCDSLPACINKTLDGNAAAAASLALRLESLAARIGR